MKLAITNFLFLTSATSSVAFAPTTKTGRRECFAIGVASRDVDANHAPIAIKKVFRSRCEKTQFGSHHPLTPEDIAVVAREAFLSAEDLLEQETAFCNDGVYRRLQNILEPVLDACKAYESLDGVTKENIESLRTSTVSFAPTTTKNGRHECFAIGVASRDVDTNQAPIATRKIFQSRSEKTQFGSHHPLNLEGIVAMAREAFSSAEDLLEQETAFYNDGVYRRLQNILEPVLDACIAYESLDGVTKENIESLRTSIRGIAYPLVNAGPFGREIANWPRGPGSSTAMQFVYEGLGNLPTYSVRAHYMDRFLRDRDLAHAVRSRKDTLRDILARELSSFEDDSEEPGPIKILDLANGPIQSLKEVLLSGDVNESAVQRIEYTGYDTDGKVQQANRDWIEEFGGPIEEPSFRFLQDSALAAPFRSTSDEYDLVYSTGFFDYLPDRVLVKIWKKSYQALAPGGRLVISLKDATRYNPAVEHYFVHWDHFFQRDTPHFEGLLEKSGMPDPESIIRDNTGAILFYTIRKA